MFGSRGRALTCAVIAASLLAGCSTEVQETPTVVVGAGSDATRELLAHIYAGAVRSAGVSASVRTDLGERRDVLAALDAGEVSLVPEFTGDLLDTFDSLSGATDAEDVFVDLNRSLPEGLSVGDYALAEDRTAVAVSPTGPYADLASLSEFAPACADEVFAVVEGPVGSPTRPAPDPVEVADRLGRGYECSPTGFRVYPDSESAVDALEAGEVGALAFTTATFGPLAADSVTLEDDAPAFTAQNVVPLMRVNALDDAAYATLSVVAGELTTADLADMIGEVRGGASSGDVAARWLGEHNL